MHPRPLSRSRKRLLVGLFVSLLLAPWGGRASQAQPVSTGTSNPSPTACLPTGSRDPRLVAFDACVRRDFARSKVPGLAIAVVVGDRVVYQRTLGVRKAGSPEAVDAQTLFPLASVSKSFTSAALAVLVGEGRLSWDDRIAALDRQGGLPAGSRHAFRLRDPVANEGMTIRDLLAHRCGLVEYAGDELAWTFGYDRQEVLYRLRFLTPVSPFGTRYAYQNFAFTAGAETVAARMKMSWEDLLTRKLLQPLGMTATHVRFADVCNAPNAVVPHGLVNGRMVARPFLDEDADGPAGGICSTLGDMTRYVRMQLNDGLLDGRQVVPRQALLETRAPQTPMDGEGARYYGLGWMIAPDTAHRRIFHGGDQSVGISTVVCLLPDRRAGIVVLTNAFPEGNILASSLTGVFADLFFDGSCSVDHYAATARTVQAALGRHDPAADGLPVPASAVPTARPLDAYAGSYEHPYYGKVRIVRQGDALRMILGKNPESLALVPCQPDVFIIQQDADAKAHPAIRFRVRPDGRVVTVRLGFLTQADPVFERTP